MEESYPPGFMDESSSPLLPHLFPTPESALLAIYNGDQEVVSAEWSQLSAPVPNWLYVFLLINDSQLQWIPVDFIALTGFTNR